MPVLYLRDGNGNFVPIPAIKGDNGKSAYEQAKEGGYTGTEAEFIAFLNGMTSSEDAAHYSDFNNPHNVTAEQVGAIPEIYYASDDLDQELHYGESKMIVCSYHSGTLHTPYQQNLTDCAHGMVITNAFTEEYGTQLCMPSGSSAIFVRELNGGYVTSWEKLTKTEDLINHITNYDVHNAASNGGGALGTGAKTAEGAAVGLYAETVDDSGNPIDAIQLGNGKNTVAGTMQVYSYQLLNALGMIPSERLPIATGSYEGTNKYGVNNPLTLTFPFVPKVVFISPNKKSSCVPFAWIYGSPVGMTAYNNSQMFASNLTWNGNTLTWYTTDGYPAYQYNNSETTYYWVAIG